MLSVYHIFYEKKIIFFYFYKKFTIKEASKFIFLTYIIIFSIMTKIAFSLKEKGSFRRFFRRR